MLMKVRKIMLLKYMLLACIFAASAYTTPMEKDRIENHINHYSQYKLSPETLAHAIKDLEIQHPEWVYRQAILESGWLKSKLTKTQNNLFGMKMPRKRETLAKEAGRKNYAVYETWVHSVADYKLYQGYTEIENYKTFLKKRKYSETSDYINRLESIKIPENILEILNS